MCFCELSSRLILGTCQVGQLYSCAVVKIFRKFSKGATKRMDVESSPGRSLPSSANKNVCKCMRSFGLSSVVLQELSFFQAKHA